MKTINFKPILIFILLSVTTFSLFPQIMVDSPQYDLLQDAPVIAFIPFSYTSGVGSAEVAKQAEGLIAKAMSDRMLFAPYTLEPWLKSAYSMEKAQNFDAIIKRMEKEKFSLNYICQGSIFKSGRHYGLIVKLYPFDQAKYESYYFRYFTSLDNLSKSVNEIVDEMAARFDRDKAVENLFNKTIYIEKFVPKFLFPQKTVTGDVTWSELPFMNVNKVDYKNTDQFFNELFLYNFHKTKLFNMKTNNMVSYLVEEPQTPDDVDYVISGDIVITNKVTKLDLLVIDHKTGSVVLGYEYPFGSLTMTELDDVFYKNVLVIISRILDAEQIKRVGFTSIHTSNRNMPIFSNDYFIGTGKIDNLILPFGLNTFQLGAKKYKRFVLPVTYSKYYGEESLMDIDLIELN